MKQYRKKPVVIEAIQFTDETFKEVNEIEGVKVYVEGKHGEVGREGLPSFAAIETLEGTMTANVGDWIITGVKGEKYPCKPDIFEMTYEAIEGEQLALPDFEASIETGLLADAEWIADNPSGNPQIIQDAAMRLYLGIQAIIGKR